MNAQINTITINKYGEKKNIKIDAIIALLFFVVLFLIGLLENNLILPDDGLGFLEHRNTYFFLFLNLMVPFVIYKIFMSLKCSIDQDTLKELEKNFQKISELPSTAVLFWLARVIGFCFFIENSLQNAQLFNQLSFDYWDSIKYPISYIVSRIYKLYLLPFLFPNIFIYVFIFIKAISCSLIINDAEVDHYPLKRQAQFNALCNSGLNIFLTILIPVIADSIIVYSVHNRFDFTTIITVIISGICAIVALYMYILLVKNFYVSITKYKQRNIERINESLSEIHQYILQYKFDENSQEKLDVALKKEEYLYQTKDKIEKQSKFPYLIKATFTIVSPIVPSIVKIILHL